MKCYVIVSQPDVEDYWDIEKVYTNKEEAQKEAEYLNRDYVSKRDKSIMCEKCLCKYDLNEEIPPYTCINIKSDRYGKYCENIIDQYTLGTYYYIKEVELLDKFEQKNEAEDLINKLELFAKTFNSTQL